MKYTIKSALAKVKRIADIKGKRITLNQYAGIGTWGALDFLKKQGYFVIPYNGGK